MVRYVLIHYIHTIVQYFRTRPHIHTYVYTYIYIYMCVCVYVYVCMYVYMCVFVIAVVIQCTTTPHGLTTTHRDANLHGKKSNEDGPCEFQVLTVWYGMYLCINRYWSPARQLGSHGQHRRATQDTCGWCVVYTWYCVTRCDIGMCLNNIGLKEESPDGARKVRYAPGSSF
jgi:hypothetical protein